MKITSTMVKYRLYNCLLVKHRKYRIKLASKYGRMALYIQVTGSKANKKVKEKWSILIKACIMGTLAMARRMEKVSKYGVVVVYTKETGKTIKGWDLDFSKSQMDLHTVGFGRMIGLLGINTNKRKMMKQQIKIIMFLIGQNRFLMMIG